MAASVVQSASNGGTGTSLTVTLASPVSSGNTICASVSVWDQNTSAISPALTLGSSPDNWAQHRKGVRSSPSIGNTYAAVWSDPGCAGGATTVTITVPGATGGLKTGVVATVWETTGIPAATVDITASTSGSGSVWTSGTFTPSATTADPDEIWVGALCFASEPSSVSGTGSPWASAGLTGATSLLGAVSAGYAAIAAPGATGNPLWSGTMGGGGTLWSCAAMTLRAGTAGGTASLSGEGEISAAAGVQGAAALSGAGGITAAARSGSPDTSGPVGEGTVTAQGTVAVTGAASLSGQGFSDASGGLPVEILVVNQWTGAIAQAATLGPVLPPNPSVSIELIPASSVGGGSGYPSQGSWLFAVAGWRQDPGVPGVTVSVSDDTHQWWRPASPSQASGQTRTTIWYQPNIGAVTFPPTRVYVAPSGYIAGMSVLVFEVTGLGDWDSSTGASTAYTASGTHLTLTLSR